MQALRQTARVRTSVAVAHDLVAGIAPFDDREAAHRSDTLGWLESTDDVFRRSPPATPPRHLVSYVVLLDLTGGAVLLVDHIKSGLWLPPGGHVDPEEHPARTARRECREELGCELAFLDREERPSFLTVTTTVGLDAGHTDVSLWFVGAGRRDMALAPDRSEFHRARWWSRQEVATAAAKTFDPHFGRFLAKVEAAAAADQGAPKPAPPAGDR
jgi:8-oxo-dGTP pyrophosphatase MutT (NUDIX family)